jgi:hypothetical protein
MPACIYKWHQYRSPVDYLLATTNKQSTVYHQCFEMRSSRTGKVFQLRMEPKPTPLGPNSKLILRDCRVINIATNTLAMRVHEYHLKGMRDKLSIKPYVISLVLCHVYLCTMYQGTIYLNFCHATHPVASHDHTNFSDHFTKQARRRRTVTRWCSRMYRTWSLGN